MSGDINVNSNYADAGLNKLGAGTLTIKAQNTYAGPTLVSGGVLEPSQFSYLPYTKGVTIDGGTFAVASQDDLDDLCSGR